jgi:GNAT superfamily N-acetyltransferase
MAKIETTVTYLEMTDPSELSSGGASDDATVAIREVGDCTVSFYRYLYGEVGRAYHWVERTRWSDEQLAARLSDPAVRIWVLTVENCPAGYFELFREGDEVEIAYFGLLDEWIGRGLGKRLLEAAVREAWAIEPRPRRVWLHTCDLDAPQALPNYVARGFRPYKTETETIETIE